MNKIKRLARPCAMVCVSAILAFAGYAALGHGSSAAFEVGIAMIVLAVVHPIWWPAVKGVESQ